MNKQSFFSNKHSLRSSPSAAGLKHSFSSNKKLKIGVVTDQLLAGGVQLAAIEQVKVLNKLGHIAKLLILMRKKYPTDFSYLVKDVPHQFLSDSYPLPFRKTIKFPVFSFLSTLHLMSPKFAPRVVKKEDYDVLVSLGTTTCLTTQAIFRRRKIPYIAVIHDPIVYILEKTYSNTFLKYFFPLLKPIARYFENSFVKDASKTLIISQVHYDYIKNNYGITPQILGFGTKTLYRIPKQRGDNLLSFGRWQKEKNPQFLLDLVRSIPKVKLIIAGHWIIDDELKQFRSKIKKYNLENRVLLVPHYENDELAKLCARSRVFVHPHFEAFGLAALEAAGHGLPIVMPEKSGVTEQFTHGIHGFFPKKITIEEYKKYILQLSSSERLAYKMGLNAWKLVKKKYSWRENVKNLLHIINSTLNTEGKSNILILEIGHALGAPLAGGDKLMEPMATRLKDKYTFSIVVSSVGAKHWENAPLDKEIVILPRNRFDESGKPIHVFLAYCIRMWQAYNVLKVRLKYNPPSKPNSTIMYSSTNILPDVLPSYFMKKQHPEVVWIARVHHLIPPPHRREGKLLVNVVSYLMQLLALAMIKNLADITIVLNAQLAKDLENRGFLKDKLKILGGGIDFKKISNVSPNSAPEFQGVFLGRLHVTKGIFDTIPIWGKVSETFPNATLAMIGDGPPEIKRELEEKIKQAHLSKNIHILGYLPSPKLYAIMKKAKLFLFLDHEAGWGLAVAEAMACGLPVVGYDNGVLGSVYKSGFRTVSIGNYTDCAKEIINLLQLAGIRGELARQAKKEAAKHDWAHTSRMFQKILDSTSSVQKM